MGPLTVSDVPYLLVCLFFLVLVALLQRVAELEKVNAEFLRTKQQLEQEFNQKRAKFKELYLAKEGKFWVLQIILKIY